MAALGVLDGLPAAAPEPTGVAGSCEGSSNPTVFASNRRVAVTARGRVLALYDPHGSGQQLTWRDRGDGWETRTRGRVEGGDFAGEAPGDRTAAIALVRDGAGEQHGWVVLTGTETAEYPLPVRMARLSDLDDPRGPRVGREVTVRATAGGNARADIAFERGPKGRRRGVISWLRHTEAGSFQLMVAWFGRPGSDAPRLHHAQALLTAANGRPTPTLVPTRRGIRLVATTGRGRLRLFAHRAGAPLRRWSSGRARVPVAGSARPSAVWVPPGVMAAAEGRRGAVVVVRLSSSGDEARVVRRLRGHSQPALTGSRRRAWLFMVRSRDGALVSRSFRRGSGWSARDRVELPANRRGLAWPNAARRARRGLHVLVQGRRCPTSPKAHEVMAVERRTGRK